MWNVARARDAAWVNAEALWALRDEPELSARYLDVLDRTVGLTARGLLVPADTWLQKLGTVDFAPLVHQDENGVTHRRGFCGHGRIDLRGSGSTAGGFVT